MCEPTISSSAGRSEQKQLLTIAELSQQSGVSVSTLGRLRRDRKIPFFQPGGRGTALRFPPNALEQACGSADPPAATSPPTKKLSGRRPAWMDQKHETQTKENSNGM